MRLADFEYYHVQYGGVMLTGDSFFGLSQRASAIVNSYTFGRAAGCELDAVKDAVCAVCEVIYKHEVKNKKTENNDGFAVTYQDFEKSLDDETYDVICTYLQPTGLMKRGTS